MDSVQAEVFLITPPFTQVNTPYPATAYLKGFLNTQGISSRQSDLGIEVMLDIFCREGLSTLFEEVSRRLALTEKLEDEEKGKTVLEENSRRIFNNRHLYIRTIDSVIHFLQGKNPSLAHRISGRHFLPEASRFQQLDDLQWAFGSMGLQDKAKHLATMYLEDLSDFIKAEVDEHFGFSRYAERLGRSAHEFDELYAALQQPPGYIDRILLRRLAEWIEKVQPTLVAISIPFPGNLYAALRCAQWLRAQHPHIHVAMGGGFANTELRSLKDTRFFEFFHYVTLDDGESPILQLIRYCRKEIQQSELKRCLLCTTAEEKDIPTVVYINQSACGDFKQGEVGTPDYSDLHLDHYISAIEIINPMHSLWNDGRWNKLTMAHGCYWGKCTFCDTSLDYIQRYEPLTAAILCNRMEELIAQTGQTGFHFVDEAAPPALMRELALEILRRGLVVSWWTNIRFEKSFTRDLCLLLRASGCIAVSGGLEVASDRLLQLIQKGITVAQVARVNRNFTEAGIMVHAYLMYGFPTQTAQETIDSLEMVRQMFEAGILQSGFWHQFAMTAHSPVGLNPTSYRVKSLLSSPGSFANNDVPHEDPTGADHELFSYGLKKSLLNFMHGSCLDYPLQKWFEHKVPKTSIDPNFIRKALEEEPYAGLKPQTKVYWLGYHFQSQWIEKTKKGNSWKQLFLEVETPGENVGVRLPEAEGNWLIQQLQWFSEHPYKSKTLGELQADYEAAGLPDFELFWFNKPMNAIYKAGLLQF